MAQTFNYINGNPVSYEVPPNTECIKIQAWGARGGGADGGFSGYVEAIFMVNPGDLFDVCVGGTASGPNQATGGTCLPSLNGGNANFSVPGSAGGGAGSYVIAAGGFTNTDGCLVVSGGGGGQGITSTGTPRSGGSGGGINAINGLSGGTGGAGGGGGAMGGAAGLAGAPGTGGAAGFAGDPAGNGGVGQGGGGGGGRRGGGGGGYSSNGGSGAGGGGNGYIHPSAFVASVNANPTEFGYLMSGVIDGKVIITPVVCPCIAEGTLVSLASGHQVPIEALRSGAQVVNSRGGPVRVEQLIKFSAPSKRFVRIAAGAFGVNQPATDLLIREGHPLLLGGREVLPEQLLDMRGVERVQLDTAVNFYTLVTEQRCFVAMQGLLVGTWSEASWENAVQNDAAFRLPFVTY